MLGDPAIIKFYSRAAHTKIIDEGIAHVDGVSADRGDRIHLGHIAGAATLIAGVDDEIRIVSSVNLDHRSDGQICGRRYGKRCRALGRSTGNCRSERYVEPISQVYDSCASKNCLVGSRAT